MPILRSIVNHYRRGDLRGVGKAFMKRLTGAHLRIHPLQVALEEVMRGEDYTIVQIGAYVGNTANDPIFSTLKRYSTEASAKRNRHSRIILIEPVKQYFEQLQANYADVPGIYFENVAVAAKSGIATLYQLGVNPADYGYPEWLSQLSSLKEDRISHLVNDEIRQFYLKNRVAHEVDCIDFNALVTRYALTKIDVLQIDIEGYEYELMKTIDFDSLPVRFINYESEVMYGNKPKCERFLRSKTYHTIDYEQDTFCFRQPDRQLIEKGVYGPFAKRPS
jgi:FkbM family methyltransferase